MFDRLRIPKSHPKFLGYNINRQSTNVIVKSLLYSPDSISGEGARGEEFSKTGLVTGEEDSVLELSDALEFVGVDLPNDSGNPCCK